MTAVPGLVDVTADLKTPRQRVAVRRRDPTGTLTDVLGVRLEDTDGGWCVLPDDGPVVTIPGADVVAARNVPPRAVRPASSAAKIERIAVRGWPGTEQYRLGAWVLRAGYGWTRRANSVLASGDPGLPIDDALEVVEGFYTARGLTPLVHTCPDPDGTDPSGIETELGRRGWVVAEETQVLVTALRALPAPEPVPSDVEITWAERPDDDWFDVGDSADRARRPAALAVLTAVPAAYLTLRRGGCPVAVGRVVVTDDWAGIAGIAVAPRARRGGLGRVVTELLLERARAAGARCAYLQILADNTAALALYEGLGFRLHHPYRYLRRP